MMCGKNLALWYCILPLIASSSVFWTNLTSDNEENDSTVPYQVDHENDDQILDNIVPQMCDNITCIRLCCPFGNRLINGECITEQDKFIFLKYINGYVGNSLNNGSKGVGKSFLLVVHDPCPKTRHYLLNPYYITFLANGALYIPYYNAIIESTSYCFATVDYNIFAANVCLESMEKVMNKAINYNKDAIHPIIKISAETNITNTIDKSESTLLEYLKNSNTDNNKNNINSDKMCDNITCIRLCCPFGNYLINGTCVAVQDNFIFLRNLYGDINKSLQNESERREELFLLIVQNPCQNYFSLYPYHNTILANGSFYLSMFNTTVESASYCLANVRKNKFTVNICTEIMNKIVDKFSESKHKGENKTDKSVIMIKFINGTLSVARILLSLMMFIVYSIVPELRNIHGFILRRYSGLVFIGETVRLMDVLIIRDMKNYIICITSAFIKYYTFLGSLFWLNVMCFDIWYTFRQLRSLQRNVKQRKRKKLIIYSVFAWGGPFILTIICSVVEFVPDFVSSDFQPNFENGCWFNDASETAYFLYYNDVGTISRIVTMCLCICTAHKIAIYEKDIAFRLKDSKGQRYNHNKQWFKLYLEAIKILFISYCIQWYMYIIQWYYNENPFMTRYVYFALDSTQHFCIFIIFVWKKKIRKLLLKRLGCQSRDMFSTECAIVSSNNSTTTSGMSSLCENTNPYANKKCHASSSFDSTAL